MNNELIKTTRQDVEDFLYQESRLLDERRFEEWLDCYHPDVEYWMPAWDDNDELTADPQSEISLIYYPNRSGLEDRVFRIRTERSSATSIPEPRTGHNITNVQILERRENEIDLVYNWITYYYRYQTTDHYFGSTYLTVDTSESRLLIKKKKIILKNDYIHHVIDIYHL
ncbi:benzoate 1,2-dioxygenase small subunit [Corynebacterium poyangense]|uniref:Benzoate 1,2-dioxygenase small subunit n=1 Tax=Corynebacterium poyangense TaxID=2684405 RepID=A0A7H0SQL0_9CORY|nr:benzoate 1,2-dioxygenase small subunit [Corynebacterium poyangense]MBZ8178273.1 benzoate 1,2-dioxygenase small subunit [Corynebacterium poyangense]QNQ90835.1 benzoate 1,2-dioxygenase small subunit [Corynebacterium poyangense]